MKPLINWEELMTINRTRLPFANKPPSGNIWDENADMYNQISDMEKPYTPNQINVFETLPTDTVLDVGCGPGRITVPMSRRAAKVTAIDTSERMLDYCRRNVQLANAKNVDIRHVDWETAELGKELEPHDIVIACRSIGMDNLAKLSRFARRLAVVITWANAPAIPQIIGDLFKGTYRDGYESPIRPMDRRLGYNLMYNIVYDLGYEPNINIVTDGYTRNYPSREAAYDDLAKLQKIHVQTQGMHLMDENKRNIFRQNADRWLTENEDGGVTFKRESRLMVLWWETQIKTY